jgi:AcrR family transcriptional regulator
MNEEDAPSSPTRRQRRSAGTRARLLDAATAVFLARGYDATTLGEVTERADLGTGTLYLHFRDKRALYEAMVRRALAGLYQRWQRVASELEPGIGRVLAMVEVSLELVIEHPEQARLLLLDGPAVESWLVDDIVKGIAAVLDGPRRDLRASLMLGSMLAAARHYVRTGQQPGARQLVETTLAFCTGGLADAGARTPTRTRARARRRAS